MTLTERSQNDIISILHRSIFCGLLEREYQLKIIKYFMVLVICVLCGCGGDIKAVSNNSKSSATPEYAKKVQITLDTLLKYGTDRYGKVHSPLFASNLDVESLTCQKDVKVYYVSGPRILGARLKRRSPGGSNQYFDQHTFKAMQEMTRRTGNPAYLKAAVDATEYMLNHTETRTTKMPVLGGHTYWDLYQDLLEYQGKELGPEHKYYKHDFHEFWNWPLAWDIFWQADPKSAKRYANQIWKYHVCRKETGETNRHDAHCGLSFTFMVGNFIEAWSWAYEKTGIPKFRDHCELVTNFHWSTRNKDTNLIIPAGKRGRRGDQQNATSMLPVFAYHVIDAGRRVDSPQMVERGKAILEAYAKYSYDKDKGAFYASMAMDGKPNSPDIKRKLVLGQETLPKGYQAIWQPYVGYHELPLVSAQVYGWAALKVDKKKYLPVALNWGDLIVKAWNDRYGAFDSWQEYKTALAADQALMQKYEQGGYIYQAPYGIFADHYGRVIQFALNLYELTNDKKWQDFAVEVADAACKELETEKIFVGHVEKRDFYENSDGVGILLYALLQLQNSLEGKEQLPLFF